MKVIKKHFYGLTIMPLYLSSIHSLSPTTMLLENPAAYVAGDYDDVNDLALYFNDPDEVPAALLASHFSPAQPAAAAADPGVDADINQFFDYEGVFEETADSDVEYYSDGDVVM